jgi:hypothetical protein
MLNKLEQIIKVAYKSWRGKLHNASGACPDEETLALFLDGRLSEKENRELKRHFIECDKCLEVIALAGKKAEDIPLPEELIKRAKNMILQQQKNEPLLEIILGFKEKIIDIIGTTGDVLFGQEFAPLPVLRSRNIKVFGQEVLIIKNFDKIKTEVEVENKADDKAKVIIKLSDINTGKPVEDLRITLIRQGKELESYIAASGKAIFDDILPDKYSIEISTPEAIIGRVLLEIRKINEATLDT